MKTAEEILKDTYSFISDSGHKVYYSTDILIAMKEYGRQCAEQALKDASENLIQASGTFNSDFKSQKLSIINTPIGWD